MHPIVTLTVNPAIDLATAVDTVTPEHKLRCDAERRDPGGGGLNVARAVNELGGASLALYAGGGVTGALLARLLDGAGLSHRAVPIAGDTRENVTVAERASRREFRFVMPGPTLSEPEWRACLAATADAAAPGGWVVASGSLAPGMPVDFYARLAREVRRRGARLVLDTSGAALRAALEEGVYLAKPNRKEFCELVGEQLAGAALAARACRYRSEGRAEILAVSMGADGALLCCAEGAWQAAALPVQPRSSVGAGDSFVAGMTLALARGDAPLDAFRLAMAAGTAALLAQGTGLCRRADVEGLLPQVSPVRVD